MRGPKLFFCAVVLSILALSVNEATASPMIAHVGDATVVLTLSPDPPQVGKVRATVEASGAPAATLARTQVTFASSMPSMSMSGPSGTALPAPGIPGRWTFEFSAASATGWNVVLHFTGGLRGDAKFDYVVAGAPSANGSMSSMPGMNGGHEDAWRIAALALAVLLGLGLIAAFWKPGWISRPTLALAVIGLVVVVGFAALQSRFAPPAMDMAAMQNVPGSAPLPVTLATAKASTMNAALAAPGSIQAYFTQDIAARVPGLLADFTAYNGARVFAGETLALLQEPELGAQAQAALAGAQSDAAAAEAAMIEAHHHAPNELAIAEANAQAKQERAGYWRDEIRREKILLDNGAVSQQEYQDERAQAVAAFSDAAAAQRSVGDAMADILMKRQEATSALEKAASSGAAAQAASIMAGYTQIISPDNAVVVKRLVDPGTYVQAGTPVLRVAVIGKVRIQANVPQEDLQSVRVGAPMLARLPGGRTIDARVTSIQPAADPTTHTAIVESVVENPGGRLMPGTFVSVVIRGVPMRQRKGTAVPSAAIVGAGPGTVIWLDVNGTAHRVPVRVYSDDGVTAEVIGDVHGGDSVIVQGAADLEEGVPVSGSPS